MTSSIKLLILEYLYDYYINHQYNQFNGDLESIQATFNNISPSLIDDTVHALCSEDLIDAFAMDNTLSCINITDSGAALIEKMKAAKKNISEIDNISENDKQEIITAIPDLMVGSQEGIKKASKIKSILTTVASSVGDTIKSTINDVASEVILKLIGLR